jgi:uncharacterized membrane protein
MTIASIILIITATTTALIAGLFYAYSCSVNLGLGRLSDAGYIAAMQSINKAILNPLFFTSFMGTLLLLPLCTFLHYGQPATVRFWILLAATLIYVIGTFGVTILGNVPLNDALAKFNMQSASIEDISRQRIKFEGPWNKLHTIRTIAGIICLILVIIACWSNSGVLFVFTEPFAKRV